MAIDPILTRASDRTLVIDFETANFSPNSACELGLVVIENHQIIHTERFLIRPPTSAFTFSYIHGITWKDVKEAPTFGDLWVPSLKKWFDTDNQPIKIVAHNIGFDKRVLEATAAHYQLKLPEYAQECTVQLSRKTLKITPAKLAHVCETLGIKLEHHAALSDAKAAAYIYLFAKTGIKYWEKPKIG